MEEAKERMSYAEAVGWAEYIRKRGSLNLAVRIELGFATVATLIVNRTGGNAKLRDYMPHFSVADDDDEGDATLDDVMRVLIGAKR